MPLLPPGAQSLRPGGPGCQRLNFNVEPQRHIFRKYILNSVLVTPESPGAN
eukprot:CAMPEP_0180059504 /NCGR_PEP_ID=MMETSP0985-20121206/5571_1 /TAXON_ID=483367 /ORGANISM="non described non described, Strain CCMP 2436" /LENGTH=50 /DNA_ID=CAMNT_0021989519 /DNA_START=135 /DNA_END=287 /DNA_ORIENTATION=+